MPSGAPLERSPGDPENDPSQRNKPYVLLISLDGFRYDYARRYQAAHLLDFARKGVAAEALIPVFPTSPFPNHYTIVTGLYPAHHGIVENEFWDRERNAEFRYNRPETAGDGRWWGGTPLWVLAEQQGMRTACFFWPGSDTEIRGVRPTYFYRYDGKVPNEQRIAQVVEWMRLPEAQRPHFVTLYFSDVDHESHNHGPDSPENRAAVLELDRLFGKLMARLDASRVPINVFVVSDHGMIGVTGQVQTEGLADWSGMVKVSNSTEIKIYSRDASKIEALYRHLHGKDRRFEVYRRDEIPARLHYNGNERIGDLLILAVKPIVFRNPQPDQPPRAPQLGMHGYDAALFPEMRAIFYAQGPDLKSGLKIGPFENVHIFPLISRLLGLQTPAGLDGRLDVLAPILK